MANRYKTFTFNTNVMLTADFDNNTDLGTIYGTIDGFTDKNSNSIAGISTVMLKMTHIGSADSGLFTGDTRATGDMGATTGKWGGQFYGNGESDSRPGSVAGTFGVTTGNKHILGAFQADKQ